MSDQEDRDNAPAGVELDRPQAFPDVDEPPAPTSVGMIAIQFFVAPLGIALAAIAVFVLASVVTTKEQRGVNDILRKIRDGGRNEQTQAAFDLAQYLNENKEIPPADQRQILSLFENRLQRARDAKVEMTKEDHTALRFLALCVGQLNDARGGDLLVSALSSRDAELKTNALFGLGRQQDVRHANEIVQVLINGDEDGVVRSVSAWVLGSLLRSDAPAASKQASEWAGALERGRDALFLIASKTGGGRMLSWNAAVALGQTGDSRAVKLLIPLLDPEEVKQLPLIDGDKGVGSGKLGRDRERAIEQAIKIAGQLGDKALIPALEKLESTSDNLSLRTRAKEAIQRIRWGGEGSK